MAKRPILTNGTIVRASLADGQPGGRVRLPDQAERARFEAFLSGNPLIALSAGTAWQVWQAALSAQPSPGGQGDSRSEKAETFLRQYLTYLRSSPRQGLRPRWCDVYEALEVAIEALAARQPVETQLGYTLSDVHEAYSRGKRDAARQPVGEAVAWMTHHDEPMLFPTAAEAAAYCEDDEQPVPLYTAPPAQAVDLGAVREALQAAEGLATVCASVDGYSREEVAASGRAMRQQFADALAKVDSQAVGK
ncbi:hypothetical protein JAK24_05940 [Stenotrophomonas maltophilia]|nr:hypothetical protein [Stenotrophomonas maltophilia]